jgi:NADPH:quinone reductase-like Zn-dependent oxidoreductase
VWEEQIEPPGRGEILCQAEKSLISIGTELDALRGVFDPGTNWFDWVKYPFRPGYSMVGRVIAVGEGVEGIKEGDRVATYGFHQQYYTAQLYDVQKRYNTPESTGVLADWHTRSWVSTISLDPTEKSQVSLSRQGGRINSWLSSKVDQT